MPEPSRTTDGVTAVMLHSGVLEVTVLPGLGMLGTSLRHRGDELLALPGGLEGYRAGSVTGLPLLAPWANRLGSRRYEVDGLVVELDGLDLTTDPNGLPIHGTMAARPEWGVVEVRQRSLAARFDFGAHPDLLASFPFPHELRIEMRVEAATFEVATTLVPTGDRAVPVAFGYHPFLRVPGPRREDVRLVLPPRRHVELDDRELPTGASRPEDGEDAPLGDRVFDDLYELGDDRALSLVGDERRVTLEVGDGYRYAQVWAPPGTDYVSLEPMTAPVNALVEGDYELVRPGSSFTATFTLRIE